MINIWIIDRSKLRVRLQAVNVRQPQPVRANIQQRKQQVIADYYARQSGNQVTGDHLKASFDFGWQLDLVEHSWIPNE